MGPTKTSLADHVCMICCSSFKARNCPGDESNLNATVKAVCDFGDTVLVPVQPSFTKPKQELSKKKKAKRKRDTFKGRKLKNWNMKGTDLQTEMDKLDAGQVQPPQMDDEDDANMESKVRERIESILKSCEEDDVCVSVCPACVSTMEKTITAKNNVIGIEAKVIKVQKYLLGLLRVFQNEMEEFYDLMEVIEGKLNSSDPTVLEDQLNFKGRSKKSQLMRGVCGKPVVNKHTIRRERVLRLRRHIVEAAGDVKDLKTRIAAAVDIKDPALINYCRDFPKSQNVVTKKGPESSRDQLSFFSEDLDDSNLDLDGSQKIDMVLDSNAKAPETRVKQEPVEEALRPASDQEDYEQTMEDDDCMDEFFEQMTEEDVPRPKRAARQIKKRYQEESSGNSNHSEDSDEDADSSSPSEHGYDSDFDLAEELSKNTLVRMERKEFESTIQDLPAFRRNFIKRILTRRTQTRTIMRKKKLEERTPFELHISQLEYKPEDRTLHLCNIRIDAIGSEDQPASSFTGLQCSQCGFQVPHDIPVGPKKQTMDVVMIDHIISEHVNGYICPHCGIELTSSRLYMRHTVNCNQHFCNICSRPLADERAVSLHRMTHMNSEEKAAAIAAGLVPPKPAPPTEHKYFCSQCGKGFALPSSLKNHEVTHQTREERGLIMCTICGKQFLEQGYYYHRETSECAALLTGVVLNPVDCSICHRTLKNKYSLRIHVSKYHSGKDTSYSCEMCGKQFKHKSNLKIHLKTHTGERPYSCSKCGQAFGRKFNMEKHMKNCSGGESGSSEYRGGECSYQGSTSVDG